MIDRNRTKPVSLYLHFPFCERKCRYCDFLSGPASDEARENYMQLLCREIALRREEVKGPVDTIFIGGGTPSLMTPSQLSRLMETIYGTFQVCADDSDPEINTEISMEINPGTADREKLCAYRRTGVNRLSIGVQSFSDAELQMLGRIHSAYQARKIFGEAREAGFDNINLDLMSALPGQKISDWEKTLLQTVNLGPEHISAYSLIIEEGTPFSHMQLPQLPTEEEDRAMYHLTKDLLGEYGYRRYEISNYARAGYACRHNCGYWTGHEYLGLGLGASSYISGERFQNPADMASYAKAVEEGNPASLRCEREILTPNEQMEEFMFLGLRMTEGVSVPAFEERFGEKPDRRFSEVITKHEAQGVILRSKDRIALTDYGLDVANYVMADYLL